MYPDSNAQGIPTGTAFHQLQDASSAMRMLEARVNSLRDKLVGDTPQPVSDPAPPSSGGLIGTISDNALSFSRCISEMNSALSQIEQKLP